ncbi:uncharacterized protein LOC143448655 [Clavelina lepadiformis]|uniref:uncharacterized protein LOC143448655 n=1 Tax=Clavelina lepadiformis TaxID=159417 RepID=UPI004041361D
MEYHLVGMQVDDLLKAISDMISQEFKSMQQDMRKEFVKMQESMEDVISTHLAEIKKTETMNNAMPVEETSQTTVVNSDISLNIEEVYSEKAPVFPFVELIKEEPLLLEEYEVSQPENDDRNISMLDKYPSQPDIGVNATVEILKPQSCVARNSDKECSDSVEMFLNKSTASETINACKIDAQLLVGNKNNKEKHFSCNFCEKSFKCKTNLKEHVRTHTGERPYQCQICDKSFIRNVNLLNHMRTHTGERPYQCNVCHKSYSDSSNLTIHLRTHTGERPYQCQICHKSFIRNASLRTHMRIHTGERPYQCDLCHKSFSDSSSSNRHLRIHTGERPYQCDVCHKSFAQYGNLKSHMRIHTGERPYQCDLCQKSFSVSSKLKTHMTNHTGEYEDEICLSTRKYGRYNFKDFFLLGKSKYFEVEVYQCYVCEKLYDKTHMITHTEEQPYQCQACDLSLTRSTDLQHHMSTYYSNVMEFHPDNMRVAFLFKAISDMIPQEFKSMRLDMQMEETKKTETMNIAISHRRNITTICVRSQQYGEVMSRSIVCEEISSHPAEALFTLKRLFNQVENSTRQGNPKQRMETDLIQNQVDGNGATMTIRHLFLQEIKSVRMNVEKEFVKLEERIEELILKHFLEETDRAKVVSNTLSYQQASEAYCENSSIFAHFEKIKEEFLLDEEQEAENLSENFENNFYTNLSRSGVSDVSSNASGIDDYSVNVRAGIEKRIYENPYICNLKPLEASIPVKSAVRNLEKDSILTVTAVLYFVVNYEKINLDLCFYSNAVQENMEDIVSKILAETKKAEIINNPIPINKTSQALDVASDIGICIKEVYSQNASVLPPVDAIKEEPLLLQHWEVSEMDEPIDVIQDEPLLLQQYADLPTEADDPTISISNKLPSQSDIGVKAIVKTIDTRNCIERSSDEECGDSVELFFDNSATNDRNNACKIQTQMFVGNNKEKRFFCKFCNKLFQHKANLNTHIRTHTGERPYQCDVCHKSFSANKDLKAHMRTHTGERPYQCDVCHKSFSTDSDLKTHMRTHTGERPYQCDVCHKSFSQSSHLKTHMRTHTGERPYQCDVCHKSFFNSSHLKIHMRTHTGERPYQCDVCHKSFSTDSDLKTHMRTHTGERPYQCNVCHKSFSESSHLKTHMRTHTGERPYQCDVCHKSFFISSHLKIHMRTTLHPVMPDPPHTELDPSISAKQCSSRSGSFSSRVVIVEEEPSLVLEQQPSEPSQKSDRKTKQNFFENATTKSVPKNHKLAIDAVTTRSVTKKQKVSTDSCQTKSKSDQDKKESAKKHLRISFGKADLVAEMQCKLLEESETPLKYDETLNDEKFNCDISGHEVISHAIVSSSSLFRPSTPRGGRWIGQALITWSAVCSVAPHSHPGEGASPHLCMSERKRPTPVRKRLSLTQAVLARDIPGGFRSASVMKSFVINHFSKEDNLSIHKQLHSTIKPYTCKYCEKSFQHKYRLNRHLLTHTGDKPLSRLSSGTCLKTHMTCHNGEKPWICEICEMRFRSKFSLARHQVTHTGETTELCFTHFLFFAQGSVINVLEELIGVIKLKESLFCKQQYFCRQNSFALRFASFFIVSTTSGREKSSKVCKVSAADKRSSIARCFITNLLEKNCSDLFCSNDQPSRYFVDVDDQEIDHVFVHPRNPAKFAMDCHPAGMQVDFLLKAISDMVSQEFKSMRQDMKIEFAKVQENMEDMVSKILAETKKAETINNEIPINKTSQALDVASDIGICIKEVYSQNALVLPPVDAIKEEPLLLQHWEVSEMDDPSMSMSNKFSHQSEIELSAVVKTVKPQTCIEENHSEKASIYAQFDVIQDEPLLLQQYADLPTETDDPTISISNKLSCQSDIAVKAIVKTIDTKNCIERSSDEECDDSVEMFFDNSATNDRNNACKIQTQVFVGNNKEKRFFCKFCNKLFQHKSNLNTHIRTHTGERPYQCDVCHKSFSANKDLKAHMRTHTGERPYQCDVCYKSFSQSNSLKTHMRTHTGERPYQCEMCHKSFSQSNSLKTHVRTHTGERPYQCEMCHKSFIRSNHLKNHMRTHTGERPYQCQVCHKSFTKGYNLKVHMKIHTGERPY